ncbi:hypothetical protein GCM10009678_11460 [Actinomadura kijaniata]|uniref:Anti-sigma factor RsiW n=1 Tax=Actinomadura namibiensis TaxID=182080 RepID=A0A7W3LNC0_ACTNM|nr:zf-HC2 domain-containing protein [Actinomadura namibiensis]MBA8951274.1 anti-sigma factor RsiW [Actinomadura namibiensis]
MTAPCSYRLDLGVYALGALPGPEAAVLRAHLAGCPDCRAELDGFRRVTALVRTARSAGPRPRTGAPTRLIGACAARGPAP